MNIKRFIKAGLIAGLVIILCAIGLVPIVGNEMDLALARFNLPPLSTGAMIYFAFVSLFTGFALIWLYVVMLERFKPRTRAALMAALVIWIFGYLFDNVSMVFYGFMPIKLTIIGTAWGLLELGAGSLIGSRFYKE